MPQVFRWAMLDPSAVKIATDKGAVPLPANLVSYVLDKWFKLECNGELLLRTEYVHQHTSALVKVVLAFSMILWVIALVLVGSAWYFSSKGRSPLFYCLCLATGASCAFGSIVLFYKIPKHTYICQLRQWMVCVGLTLLLGVMFSRSWQLHSFYRKKDSTTAKREVVASLELIGIVGVILVIQLVLLIIWTAVDRFSSYTHFLNSIDLTARYSCHSDHPLVWLLLELGFFLALLSWGIYVVYSTWSGKASIDSRWTLIAVYNSTCSMPIGI